MRTKPSIVVLALVGLLAPVPRLAAAGDEVRCVSDHDITLSPGISIRGTSGSFNVLPGTMKCEGPIDGRTPTGTGTYGEDPGRYGTADPDSCQEGGEGEGVFFSTIPTTGGDLHLKGPYTFTFGDLTANPGFVSGEFTGNGVRGTFKITPLEGDCVTSPITRIGVTAEFWFARSFFSH